MPALQQELSVSEGAGLVRNLLFIEKLGRTEQTLTISLQVETQDETYQGRVPFILLEVYTCGSTNSFSNHESCGI